jgi:light-regulated signal transduction histidine kinase (bacteriophytochrome)
MADSDQQRTENELKRLRHALDASDRAFDEFVSMAAHNLRESLRDMTSYSQLMAETFAGPLAPDAAEFLRRIRSGAERMQSLLTDMVDYAAVGAREPESSEVDMGAAFRQALLLTDSWIMERSAVVTCEPLPRVCGDVEALTKVVHHMIRNAVEYCDALSPRIHISARRVNGDWVFAVKDNGPGIEPEFQGRLFQVFKRLHGNEHPGNGLGLAFCKKAIERQGGRVWMESRPGAGSTFYFSLPPAD